jgi:hypothetical protein
MKDQREKEASNMVQHETVKETLEFLLNCQSLQYMASEKLKPLKEARQVKVDELEAQMQKLINEKAKVTDEVDDLIEANSKSYTNLLLERLQSI